MNQKTLNALYKIAGKLDPNSALALSRSGGAHKPINMPGPVSMPAKPAAAPQYSVPAPTREEITALGNKRIASIKPGAGRDHLWWSMPQATRQRYYKAGIAPAHIKNPTAAQPPVGAIPR